MSGAGPTLDSLRPGRRPDFAGLDDALTTAFVSGSGIRANELLPESSCDTKEIRLVSERSVLCGILDRLHRFERLSRYLGWSATLLDDALIWLGGALDDDTLDAIGVLTQARLDVEPATVIAFFHDPGTTERPCLVAGKKHKSSFEELFGNSGTQLRWPTTASDPSLAGDTVVSLVSALVGEGPDEVRFVLAQGYANSAGEQLTDPASILASVDPHAALRRAASATYRVTRLASGIGLSLSDLVHVIETFEVDPFPWEGHSIDPTTQLLHAVRLLSLAEDPGAWHLDPIDVRYVVTLDATAARLQGLDPHVVGQTWLQLLAAIAERQSKRKAESQTGRALLRQRLTELLKPRISCYGSLASMLESTLARLVELLSWQALFPDLVERAHGLLPSSVPASSYLSVESPSEQPWEILVGFLATSIETDFAAEDIGGIDGDTAPAPEEDQALALSKSTLASRRMWPLNRISSMPSNKCSVHPMSSTGARLPYPLKRCSRRSVLAWRGRRCLSWRRAMSALRWRKLQVVTQRGWTLTLQTVGRPIDNRRDAPRR